MDNFDDATALARSPESLTAIPGVSTLKAKTSWWKRLTREQWLSHLNKLKLSESMLESLPQVSCYSLFMACGMLFGRLT